MRGKGPKIACYVDQNFCIFAKGKFSYFLTKNVLLETLVQSISTKHTLVGSKSNMLPEAL